MLDVKALTRSYGSFKAVDDVSFTITDGEIVGLLGHNGAGKTTIMKMLSGYLEADHGSIRIDDLQLPAERRQISQHLGYLPENLPVYPEMSVADYLDYVATLKGLEGEARTDAVRQAIADTEIGSKLLAPIATLSRGFRQRVGVAQALLGNPRLLILDEPTNGLDPTQTEHMRGLIRRISATATVILSTHIMQEVEALCDRVLIIDHGHLVTDAALETLRTSHALQLRTSASLPQLTEITRTVTGVETVAAGKHEHEFRIAFTADTNLDQAASHLARAVIAANCELYSLNAETRDLESLFRDAVSQSVQQPAAKEASANAV